MLPSLKEIEAVLRNYPNTVSALEAFSTFCAVVTSLVIAFWSQRANRTSLKARTYIVHTYSGDMNVRPRPQYIAVSVINTGTYSAQIPLGFFFWKMPFTWQFSILITPLDFFSTDPFIDQRSYPVEVRPRTTQVFQISTPSAVRQELNRLWNHYPWIMYFGRWLINFKVATEDGQLFGVKASRDVRRIVTENMWLSKMPR